MQSLFAFMYHYVAYNSYYIVSHSNIQSITHLNCFQLIYEKAATLIFN